MTKSKYEHHDIITFGKYKGLTIEQIFQGSLKLNELLIEKYFDNILNIKPAVNLGIFQELELIESFKIKNNEIRVVGEIFDPDLPLGDSNRVIFGNIQNSLSLYINYHFSKNFLGILESLATFNGNQLKRFPIGGDPEYFIWCCHEINDFALSDVCIKFLKGLPIARLKGFHIMYVGNETYEYFPNFQLEEQFADQS